MRRRWMILGLPGLVLALAIGLSLAGCNFGGHGTLTITNNSGFDIDFVTWTSDDGTVYSFGDDTVWDFTINGGLGGWVLGIAALGGSDSRTVHFGSDYIYFFYTDDVIGYRTAQRVEVDFFSDGHFTFYNSTAIYTATLKDGSSESKVYSIVPVPGRGKPTD